MPASRSAQDPNLFVPLAQHCTTGFAWLDVDLRFAALNPAWSELLELGPRRLLGEPIQRLDLELPTIAAAAQRARDERSVLHLRRISLRCAPSGRMVDADLAFTPLPDGGVLLELHALGPEQVMPGPRLSESLRGFAHEVKNPLAGLRGAAQLLQRRLADSELGELSELIIAEADRLASLADRLLHASSRPHLHAVNIHEVLDRVFALLAAETDAPTLVRDFDPSLPNLRGDADRLTQLVLNLGRNAIEAGATVLTVRTRAEHGARLGERSVRLALRFEVHDNGRGVPPELGESLFLPLVSGRPEGSGLGLALCQEIAREHGGGLSFRSRPGDTTFTLLLPLESAHG